MVVGSAAAAGEPDNCMAHLWQGACGARARARRQPAPPFRLRRAPAGAIRRCAMAIARRSAFRPVFQWHGGMDDVVPLARGGRRPGRADAGMAARGRGVK